MDMDMEEIFRQYQSDSSSVMDTKSELGFLGPSSLPNPDKVISDVRELSPSLFKSFNLLREILDRHEATIQKRWLKKTNEQRRKILLDAWPNLAKPHRPDFAEFLTGRNPRGSLPTAAKEAYMWPYMNQEDLVKSKTILLLFLKTRGRNLPEIFAPVDWESIRIGHSSGAVMPAFLNEYTMLLRGDNSGSYGRLLSWDDHEDAFEWSMNGYGYTPGDGLLVLKIQDRLMKFFVDFCRSLLHDIPANDLTSDKYPIQPEPALAFVNETAYPSLSVLAMQAPYRIPSQVQFDRLEALVSARRMEAEDHVWALREDPGYFADTIADFSEHRQERIIDANGKPHPHIKDAIGIEKYSPFWGRVISETIVTAYGNLITWTCAQEQISKLAELQSKYAESVSFEERLPREYEAALAHFIFCLKRLINGPSNLLKLGFPSSLPIRSNWIRRPHDENAPNKIGISTKKGLGKDKLTWVLTQLMDENQRFLLGARDLIDEYEYIIQNHPKEKQRITPWVSDVITDIALISEMDRQVHLYQPWVRMQEYAQEPTQEEIAAQFLLINEPFSKLLEIFPKGGLQDVVMPLRQFYYPIDKPRTQERVDILRSAEKSLDNVWRAVDGIFEEKCGKSMHEFLRKFLLVERLLLKTPKWVEPVREIKPQSLEFTKTIAQGQSYHSTEATPRFQAPTISEKTKTRGPDISSSLEVLHLIPPPTPPAHLIFPVSKRDFATFKTLFFSPTSTDQPGEIPWMDFVHALHAVGFAPEKQRGSAWQFTPTGKGLGDVERGIGFHEPHPEKKLTYKKARHCGRRLNRAFGWEGDWFSLLE